MFYKKKEYKYSAPSMDYASLYPSFMKIDREFMISLKREERKRKLRQIDEIRE